MANKKTFTEDFTKQIADLSHINLKPQEISKITSQFNDSLDVINNLNQVDTKDIKEAYNITGLKNVFREDNVDTKRMLNQDEALSNSKRSHKGFFVVKGIFEDEK